MTAPDIDDLFDGIVTLPDGDAERRYDGLVGLDDVKERLVKQARILLKPKTLAKWAKEHHGREELPLVEAVRDRPPLFIFAGDVGTGKTTLAETFGHAVARAERLDGITLMRLSLSARGSGTVGEMTSLITHAFAAVEQEAPPMGDGDPSNAIVLLMDEADALAQSREEAQMHHEDRAGVNALIRGIDSIATERRPVITVLSTNRLEALDPAIRRRAFDEIEFTRPTAEQRAAVLAKLFDGCEIAEADITRLAELTGPSGGRDYGFTYSDLTTRLASAVLLDAFPAEKVTAERIEAMIGTVGATPPFSAGAS
ncbi:MAG: ATP-binding protein [Actinomycetota bacterium]|nr:ATP-binding protein [Actinomycetota bacterium]MDQ5807067.1 ATP-binding protein [Actinomycetota bacterium]